MRKAVTRNKLTGRVEMLAFAADDFTDERILECLREAIEKQHLVMVVDPDSAIITTFNSTDEEIDP